MHAAWNGAVSRLHAIQPAAFAAKYIDALAPATLLIDSPYAHPAFTLLYETYASAQQYGPTVTPCLLHSQVLTERSFNEQAIISHHRAIATSWSHTPLTDRRRYCHRDGFHVSDRYQSCRNCPSCCNHNQCATATTYRQQA